MKVRQYSQYSGFKTHLKTRLLLEDLSVAVQWELKIKDKFSAGTGLHDYDIQMLTVQGNEMKVVSVDAAGLLHAMRIQSVRSSVLGTSVQVFHKDFPLSCVPPVSTVKLKFEA